MNQHVFIYHIYFTSITMNN